MKKNLFLITLISLFLVATINVKGGNNPATTDKNFKVKLIQDNGAISIQISLNANEGSEGKLKIYNSHHQLVHEYKVALKQSPEYSSINLAEFANDNYTLELTTPSAVHTTDLTIN